MKVALPVIKVNGKLMLAPHARLSPLIAVCEVWDNGFAVRNLIEVDGEKGGGELADLLSEENVEFFIVYNVDSELLAVLESRGLKVIKSGGLQLEEAIRSLERGV